MARLSPWQRDSSLERRAGATVVRPTGDMGFNSGRAAPRRRVARCPALSTIREQPAERLASRPRSQSALLPSLSSRVPSGSPVLSHKVHAPQPLNQPVNLFASDVDMPREFPVPSRALDSSTPPTPVPTDDDVPDAESIFEQLAIASAKKLSGSDIVDNLEEFLPASLDAISKPMYDKLSSNTPFDIQLSTITGEDEEYRELKPMPQDSPRVQRPGSRHGYARRTPHISRPSSVASSTYSADAAHVNAMVRTALVISEFCKELACLTIVKHLGQVIGNTQSWSQEDRECYNLLTEAIGLNKM
jgi:hypothetical protein